MNIAITVPTPEKIAESLTSGDNEYHDGHDWWESLTAKGNVVHIGITPTTEDGEKLPKQHFRAVVVEGDETPIVLKYPAELGLTWHDGSDLLTLRDSGIIRLYTQCVAEIDLRPDEAREMAAHLAAMADVLDAASK